MQWRSAPWDDVKLFLSVARHRKLAAAAALLRVDASTASRRLAALEKRLGIRLFERTRDGLVPTVAAERLLAPAEEAEASIARFFDQVDRVERAVEGVVRVTAPPGVVELVIMPSVAELARRYPKLRLEVDANQAIASLLRREADVAVRLQRPEGEGLLVRRVGVSKNAVFGSRELVGSLPSLTAWGEAPWITWDAAHAHFASARWYAAHVRADPVVRASTLLAQIAAVESSAGVALLPTFSALKRGFVAVKCSRALAASASFPVDEVYLVRHASLRDVPRITAVWGFVLELLLRFDVKG